jgi:uncharacterized OB-fold protein
MSSAIPLPPLPAPDDQSRAYWDAAATGELVMQRCRSCQHWRFPPRPQCPECLSFEQGFERVSGLGIVFSYVVVHPPVLPAFAARVPFPVVLVELAESPRLRLVGNLLDTACDAIRIGMPVEVCFEAAGEGISLPQWRPRKPSGGAMR